MGKLQRAGIRGKRNVSYGRTMGPFTKPDKWDFLSMFHWSTTNTVIALCVVGAVLIAVLAHS